MATLTVFTPTYNRAHTLHRVYNSLCNQDCKDFVWLIIDDGSSDNTLEIVKTWQKEDNGFEIKYIYKENGGMHTAHNTAYENIDTELNICIDSDDELARGAVRKILKKWKEVKDKGYAGLIGIDVDMNTGRIIGKGFKKGMTETTLSGYYRDGGKGDKKLVYRTDVITKYMPYPVFDGEKFVALGYIYSLIDEDYKLAVLNTALCNVEYQQDGSSRNILKQYLNNPKGYAFIRKYAMLHSSSYKRLFIDCIHYCSSSLIAKNKYFIRESPKKLLTFLMLPFGAILTLYIKRKAK